MTAVLEASRVMKSTRQLSISNSQFPKGPVFEAFGNWKLGFGS